jgi:enamine deaminase RidA (YjgF/YER057c/UK114 family)
MAEAIVPKALAAAAGRARMSPAVRSGNLVFVNGTTGVAEDGTMPPDAQTQARNAFGKIGLVLAEAGLGLGHIVSMTTYHVGLRAHFELFDAVRLSVLSEPWPAWTAVEVAGLRREGAVVEISVIARGPAA